jgi:predicted DNA-binding protein (MmcQ/YjbR family)
MDHDALARVRALCLALPGATEKPGPMPGFLVRGKTFAWFTDNHHGDGRVALTLKAAPGDQDLLVTADPIRFFRPPYVGQHGWIGARLDRDPDWDELAALIRDSYRLIAPKRLVARLDDA